MQRDSYIIFHKHDVWLKFTLEICQIIQDAAKTVRTESSSRGIHTPLFIRAEIRKLHVGPQLWNYFLCIWLEGRAQTQSPTTRNPAVQIPTFRTFPEVYRRLQKESTAGLTPIQGKCLRDCLHHVCISCVIWANIMSFIHITGLFFLIKYSSY